MILQKRIYVIVLLGFSALFLASLIPGGPIENRDFSHLNVSVLGGFNIFLTALNLGTLALLYFVYRNRKWAIATTWFVGFAYFFVYAIDLAQIFPRSPTPMSQALSLIEVLGMCAAVPMMYLSWPYSPFVSRNGFHQEMKLDDHTSANESTRVTGLRVTLLAVAIALGAGIVFFATNSAMNSANSMALLANKPNQ